MICPGHLQRIIALGQISTPVSYPPASVTDNSDDAITLQYSIQSGAVFNLGQTPVRVTAVDSSNNRAFCTFMIELDQQGK